jgi:uncharacterized protein YkwD
MRRVAWALSAVLASVAPGGAADDLAAMERNVVAALREARIEAGLPALSREPVLDQVASERARQIAELPFERRMSPGGTIQTRVERAGIKRYRRVAEHVEVQSGYADPAAAAVDRWRKYPEDWSFVTDRTATRIGVGAARSDDGVIAFVAVLLADAPPLPDRAVLEVETEAAINDARVEHGLARLVRSPELAAVARAHSEDMAKRGFFAHRTPEGLGPSDRAKAMGIRYERLAENIAVNLGADDPVGVAVQGWLESQHHRDNLMNAAFVLTGVGIAETEDGELYFTQLFLTPPR